MNASGQTICLSMIVKNEASVIRRCLDSVRGIVNYWIVVDTGSSDGTQDIVRKHMEDVPGELHERPWQDFATNRTEALELARRHADYSLIIDADDVLEFSSGFEMPELTADAYMFDIHDVSVHYQRMQLVRNALPWRYRGVLHEFLTCEGSQPPGYLRIVMRRNHDGARRRAADTYHHDVAVLEAALQTEADAFMRSRYRFYLAQSYRDCGNKAKALENYLIRAELGFWDEEVYVSLLQAARIMDDLGGAFEHVLATYERASAVCAHRVEALHGASNLCFRNGRNREGYLIAGRGIRLSPPAGLFVERWIYDYGLLDEYAVNAYWAGAARDCADACAKLLGGGKLPLSERERVANNLQLALDKLPREADLGALGRDYFTDQHALAPARFLHSRLQGTPKIMLAILAKQKEWALPLYLECIEALDYPKSAIVLYIRTNNNTDQTETIIREWVGRVGHLYGEVEFDASDVPDPVEQFASHEWNQIRFRVLGRIRNISLQRALGHECDFYFVADVDNFIRPCTLRELVALNVPIAAPLLRSIDPGKFYANYHAEIDAHGYYKECDQYHWILKRWVRGVLEVPVVHCTYLIRADVLNQLTYEDDTGRFEYVIFSDSARKSQVPQYLDNRQVYGYITFVDGHDQHVADGVEHARTLLAELTDEHAGPELPAYTQEPIDERVAFSGPRWSSSDSVRSSVLGSGVVQRGNGRISAQTFKVHPRIERPE